MDDNRDSQWKKNDISASTSESIIHTVATGDAKSKGHFLDIECCFPAIISRLMECTRTLQDQIKETQESKTHTHSFVKATHCMGEDLCRCCGNSYHETSSISFKWAPVNNMSKDSKMQIVCCRRELCEHCVSSSTNPNMWKTHRLIFFFFPFLIILVASLFQACVKRRAAEFWTSCQQAREAWLIPT